MQFLHGVISDKIRKMMTADQIVRSPHPDRLKSPGQNKVSSNVNGTQLSKAGRKKV